MRSISLGMFWLASLPIFTSSVALGERPTAPSLFPDTTLAYIRVDDTRELKAKMAQTSTGKLASDPQVAPLLSEFYATIRSSAAGLQDAIGLNLDELLSIPSGELAFGLIPREQVKKQRVAGRRSSDEDFEEFDDAPPVGILLLEAGNESPAVELLVGQLEDQFRFRGGQQSTKKIAGVEIVQWRSVDNVERQFGYFVDSGVFVFSTVAEYIESLAMVWTGNGVNFAPLTQNRKFTDILSRCVGVEGERPQVSVYVDPLAIAKEANRNSTAGMMVMAILPSLGLDGFRAVGGTLILNPSGFDSIVHVHLLLANPRQGVLRVLRPKSGPTTPQAWVAEDVASYLTVNWNIQATVGAIKELFETFRGPDAFEEEVISNASRGLGIDFRKDFLDLLQDRITMAQVIVRPVRVNSSSNVFAFALKQPRDMSERVLPKFYDHQKSRDSQWTTVSHARYKVYTRPSDQRSESLRSPAPAITVLGNELLVSDSIEALKSVIDVFENPDGLLSESLEFKLVQDRIRSHLKANDASIIQFQRPEETLRVFYDLAANPENVDRLRQMADNNPFFGALVSALDRHALPPFETISKYLAPTGAFLVEEETGLHYTAFGLQRGK